MRTDLIDALVKARVDELALWAEIGIDDAEGRFVSDLSWDERDLVYAASERCDAIDKQLEDEEYVAFAETMDAIHGTKETPR